MRVLKACIRPLTAVVGLAVICCAWAASPAWAQPTDAIEKLRQILKTRYPIDVTKETLNYRKQELLKAANALQTAQELRTALSLSEWKDVEGGPDKVAPIDREVRTAIGKRFEEIIKDVVSRGDAKSWKPTADLLGEIGVSIRALSGSDKGGFARSLAPSLIELLGKNDPQVRQAAARALGKINADSKLAVPALEKLQSSDRPDSDRRAAAEALADMVKTVYENKKKGRVGTGVEITEFDVASCAGDVIPATGASIKDSDAVVRSRGLTALLLAASALNGFISTEPLDPTIMPASGQKWDKIEEQIVQDAKQKVARLVEMVNPMMAGLRGQGQNIAARLTDKETENRELARHVLEQVAGSRLQLMRLESSIPTPFGAPEAKPADPLFDALNPGLLEIAKLKADPKLSVRQATIEFLETMEEGAAPALDALLVLVGDRDRFIRWAAARTLGKVGLEKLDAAQKEKTVLAIARLLDPDEDADVRAVVANTLRNFGPDARPALPALVKMLNVGEAESQEEVIKAIMSIGGADAPDAIKPLEKSLDARSANVRRLAAEALGRMGARAASSIAALNDHAQDEDASVRLAIAEALVNITRPPN